MALGSGCGRGCGYGFGVRGRFICGWERQERRIAELYALKKVEFDSKVRYQKTSAHSIVHDQLKLRIRDDDPAQFPGTRTLGGGSSQARDPESRTQEPQYAISGPRI